MCKSIESASLFWKLRKKDCKSIASMRETNCRVLFSNFVSHHWCARCAKKGGGDCFYGKLHGNWSRFNNNGRQMWALSKHNNQFTIWAFSAIHLKLFGPVSFWSVFISTTHVRFQRKRGNLFLIADCSIFLWKGVRPPTPWLRLLLSFFNFVHTCQLACWKGLLKYLF